MLRIDRRGCWDRPAHDKCHEQPAGHQTEQCEDGNDRMGAARKVPVVHACVLLSTQAKHHKHHKHHKHQPQVPDPCDVAKGSVRRALSKALCLPCMRPLPHLTCHLTVWYCGVGVPSRAARPDVPPCASVCLRVPLCTAVGCRVQAARSVRPAPIRYSAHCLPAQAGQEPAKPTPREVISELSFPPSPLGGSGKRKRRPAPPERGTTAPGGGRGTGGAR